MPEPSTILFTERQRLVGQPVIWIAWIGFAAMLWYLMSQDLLFGAVYYIGIAMIVAGIGLSTFTRLDTEIDTVSIRIKMFPFHRTWKVFLWEEIESAELTRYKPIGQYGGWGIRKSFSSTAYNIKGNIGLRLTLKSGRSYMIGTQKANELMAIPGNRIKDIR